MNNRWHFPAIAFLSCTVVFGTFVAARDRRHLQPPPRLTFGGLPVSGSLADAIGMGFNDCFKMNASEMRCRRRGVLFEGHGPFEAAIDLAGGDGRGGFRQLILWHDWDQYAVYSIGDAFERHGWRSCSTYNKDRGDQVVYMHPGARFRVSMDMSYYGKRRIRLIPEWNTSERRCRLPSTQKS